ncbi:hypothetical protein TNCT_73121 [Trichonephila clavata]|uniref:Transposase n=1 Tax=Trichonephila clavata TaxID=2740835 RepID=A0A8X6G8Y9_TRICU|nr:hypothetical protein TNCT_73121 [Trichonephila clavata]
MLHVYREKCLSRKAVYNWGKKFPQSPSKIVDEDQSSHPLLITTKPTEKQVEESMRTDQRGKIDSFATAIRCSYDLAYSIMYDRLNFRKAYPL